MKHGEYWLIIKIRVATNLVTAFYTATFPGLVRDLPKLIQSEQEVKEGTKTSVFAANPCHNLYREANC